MSLFETRVGFLVRTEPELTWERFNKDRKKLYQDVTDVIDKALRSVENLKNLPPGGRTELLYNYVAPRDVPDAKNQLTEEQESQINAWAIDPPEGQEETT